MGHLVNPIAWRLGKNLYWNSLYYVNNLDFAYNNVNDINLFIFLNKFFKNKLFRISGFLTSNFKILRFFSGTFVYALFKIRDYNEGGIEKYSRSYYLNKLFKKRLFKRRPFYQNKKRKKPSPLRLKGPGLNKQKTFGKPVINPFRRRVTYITDFYDHRLGTIKKTTKKMGRFISRRRKFRKTRYFRKKSFLHYSTHVSNFKKNFEYVHKRETERYKISRILKKVKRIFLLRFSRKKSYRNYVFNKYFYDDPLDYYTKRSISYKPGKEPNKYLETKKDDNTIYNTKKFFIFNILKLFPKVFLNFSNKYTVPNSNYTFIKNRFKFKVGFYSNFLHVYRKLPSCLFIKNFLSAFVNKFFYQVKFTFLFCSERFMSSNLVRDFILSKISHKLKINRITFAVLRLFNNLYKRRLIKGFRILLAGRFTRKDRATFYWKKSGFLSPNNRMATLDYSFGTRVLRYSLCVCKIWINN